MSAGGIPTDASSLIHLAKAGQLELAHKALGPLLVPPAVWVEAITEGERIGAVEVPVLVQGFGNGWLRRVELGAKSISQARTLVERHGLGQGEAQVMAIAGEYAWILLDEHRGARRAEGIGIVVMTSLLLPLLCVDRGLLDTEGGIVVLRAIALHSNPKFEQLAQCERDIRRLSP
jgi:predicted nucleic acid-binding protein